MFNKIRTRLVKDGPRFLRYPLQITPFALQRDILEQFLSWQFREALAEGDLHFLEDKWLKVEIKDLHLQWFISVCDDKLIVSRSEKEDVSFSGNANDLILIAARKEDPDTLFFQRRLQIEGDTELGLYVKNLMDAIELDSMPSVLRFGLLQLADFVKSGLQDVVEDTAHSHELSSTSC
ncbi:TPA: SCP2 domain-containing protein [Proteus mirabilis]|uniref:ubiquinone anaerobic biosynthesis accessory factor UbiT n=1 Tax=Proteus mirabilis TaxID=584 RepID=UPI00228DF981|nr:SCP2 domain-containing protein [Proteus mirabilis]